MNNNKIETYDGFNITRGIIENDEAEQVIINEEIK